MLHKEKSRVITFENTKIKLPEHVYKEMKKDWIHTGVEFLLINT